MIEKTAKLVAAYLSRNTLAPKDVPDLIRSIHAALGSVGTTEAPAAAPVPAVPIKKSVAPDALTCLDCGKRFKMLKRHLSTDHGLTIDEYRHKWGLPADYPVVAPAYAEVRSSLAKSIGLGTKKAG